MISLVPHRFTPLPLLLLLISGVAAPALALQAPRSAESPQGSTTQAVPGSPFEVRNAHQTREMLQQILRQYPPSVSQVFRLDPSLLTNASYLASYPNLSAFLNSHPEVTHNASFFFGSPDLIDRYGRFDSPEGRSIQIFQDMMIGLAIFVIVLTVGGVLLWIIRTVIDHRRWLRVSKVQTEVHSKLLDRFTANQDLLAYIQTDAGRRFLESAPISVEGPRAISAPVGRILFSVQAGIVLALGGLGLHLVSQALALQEIAQPLFVLGVLALALGIGFVLSAIVAYMLSRRLGLLDRAAVPAGDTAGVPPPHA
jgi:hypothetical protein